MVSSFTYSPYYSHDIWYQNPISLNKQSGLSSSIRLVTLKETSSYKDILNIKKNMNHTIS